MQPVVKGTQRIDMNVMTKPEKTAVHPNLTFQGQDLDLEINCRGSHEYVKVSYPVKYGLYSKLETPQAVFEFNLNHELTHAKSKSPDWLHPSEWLKRTIGNDWIYYSSGGYSGVYESIGEYYLPNLSYTTNSLLGGKPFREKEIARICRHWQDMIAQVPGQVPGMPEWAEDFIAHIKRVTPEYLDQKARTLFRIPGGRVSVLPPDARHSDYNVIPLNIADGCLYKCKFCRIKNKKPFAPRPMADIMEQIREFKQLYGPDLVNVNSLYLGEHDALNAPEDLILSAARAGFDEFEFARSFMTHPRLYLFGSVDALLGKPLAFFDRLNRLPFETFINIGFESSDQNTLDTLGKPITTEKVETAFSLAQNINQQFINVEITGNFVMDESLASGHTGAMMALVREQLGHTMPKGAIYLSPLKFGSPSREILYDFYRLKSASRLPMYLYIIQRL